VLAAVALSASLALPAGAQAQTTAPDQSSTSSMPPVTAAPAADVRLSGSVEEGPPAQGIATGDTMRYRISIRNQGPEPIPAGGLLLVLSVGREDGGPATMEVAGFNDDANLRPAQGGACGIGTRAVLRCTNRQLLQPGAEIALVVAHRHPAPEPGSLSFVAESSIVSAGISDPDLGNNSYRGLGYRFTIQPSTTTTSSTVPPSSMVDPSTPTSDASSSTTVTTLATTTTTSAPATTAPTTTLPTTTTTVLQAMTDESASLIVSQPTLVGAAGPSDQAGDDQELLLAPTAQEPGGGDGPPVVLLGALGAVVLLAGGVALALYLRLSQEPPLVDIRRFD